MSEKALRKFIENREMQEGTLDYILVNFKKLFKNIV